MQVNQAGYIQQGQNRSSTLPIANDTNSSAQATHAQASISPVAHNAGNNWQAIADKYDVTNISMRERGAMVNELVQSGFLSSEEAMMMARPYKINDEPNVKRNWLEISQGALEFAKQNGSPASTIELMEKNVSTLAKLNQLGRNSDQSFASLLKSLTPENKY
ncbi:hypothetical protein ACMXYO_00755 [Neptuniibacter sp. QD37_6]|uniref:hypothetical protein n=1 Tax=Neptuniibacter sp. QD37_6 TaxID=3398210 RepID=UPI0039F56865